MKRITFYKKASYLKTTDQREQAMKPDVLTITAIVFVMGVLISSLGITDDLTSKTEISPPSALQQGIDAKR